MSDPAQPANQDGFEAARAFLALCEEAGSVQPPWSEGAEFEHKGMIWKAHSGHDLIGAPRLWGWFPDDPEVCRMSIPAAENCPTENFP